MNKESLLIISGFLSLCALILVAIFWLPAWMGILIICGATAAALAGFFLRKNRERLPKFEETFEAPLRKDKRVNDLAVYLQKIREEEKLNLSRELHDVLGQLLTALRMDIAWLDRGIRGDQPRLRHKINDMIEVTERMIRIVQKLCTDLRPSILDDLGLVAAIQWQAKDFEKYSRVPVTMDFHKEDIPMGQEEATILFRVFQEALINIGRYARATKVQVSLKEKEDVLILRIRDNGVGIPDEKVHCPDSYGLMAMRQRLLSRGGNLTIKGEKNKGTTVEAALKLSKETAPESGLRVRTGAAV